MTGTFEAGWVSPRDLMPRVDAICRHPRFQRELARIDELEHDRAWCRHGLSHLLDVARIAWIDCVEAAPRDPAASLSRELVYAAALLHDIGRAEQYETGTPHDEAGERIAIEILGTVEPDARFDAGERSAIAFAVRGHRRKADGDAGAVAMPGRRRPDGEDPCAEALQRVIARADKASRACFACPARATCNWPDAKKNLTVVA